MLVLSRKPEEALVINGNIEIVVLGIEDGKVRLGIQAPPEVKIYRKEVLEAVEAENKAALDTAKILLKK
jgi:carbon storage regulator